MKRRILVYYSILNIGGAERSLIRFMNALCRDGNSVTCLTNYANGTAMHTLDPDIQCISFSKSNQDLENKGLFSFFRRIFVSIERFYNSTRFYICNRKFDIAVLGSHGMSTKRIKRLFTVCKYLKFIRTDLSCCGGRETAVKLIGKEKEKIDYYLCVSKATKESFDRVFPNLSEKSFVLYNFLDTKEMKEKIEVSINPYPNDKKIHIASVCRVSDKSKGVFRMLEVCEQLIAEGLNVSWYIVGDGADLAELNNRTKEKGLENSFILVGRKDNPFGYYKYSDLVAVLSYYEGLCGTVNEAKISGAAVIATEFSGIYEQLTHRENGWIVKNNTQSIIQGMRDLLSDHNTLMSITNDKYPSVILDDDIKLQSLYSLLRWE